MDQQTRSRGRKHLRVERGHLPNHYDRHNFAGAPPVVPPKLGLTSTVRGEASDRISPEQRQARSLKRTAPMIGYNLYRSMPAARRIQLARLYISTYQYCILLHTGRDKYRVPWGISLLQGLL
jgi:hypothetical protein